MELGVQSNVEPVLVDRVGGDGAGVTRSIRIVGHGALGFIGAAAEADDQEEGE